MKKNISLTLFTALLAVVALMLSACHNHEHASLQVFNKTDNPVILECYAGDNFVCAYKLGTGQQTHTEDELACVEMCGVILEKPVKVKDERAYFQNREIDNVYLFTNGKAYRIAPEDMSSFFWLRNYKKSFKSGDMQHYAFDITDEYISTLTECIIIQ